MLLPWTLLENLTFGCQSNDIEGSEERVIRVCEKFQLPLAIMEHVKSKDVHNWEAVLSDTEIRCLGLIRALIANPEVLCIQKPTQLFDEQTAMQVHKLVR